MSVLQTVQGCRRCKKVLNSRDGYRVCPDCGEILNQPKESGGTLMSKEYVYIAGAAVEMVADNGQPYIRHDRYLRAVDTLRNTKDAIERLNPDEETRLGIALGEIYKVLDQAEGRK